MTLLDVGCGPGTITADLAKLVAPGLVIGVDRSEDVLAQAERPPAAEANLRYETGDIYALAYEDDTFDVVHAHQVLQHLSDPVAALHELARVAKPGGLIAVRDADYHAMTYNPADAELAEFLELYQRVARSNEAEPDAGRFLLAWAHSAGLRDVAATATAWCYATPSEREWWGGLWAARSTESAIATTALEKGFATQADLERFSQAWLRWAADDDAWFAVLNGELLIRV